MILEGKEREKGVESLFEEIIVENFLDMSKDLDIQIQELIDHSIISMPNVIVQDTL